MPAPTARSTARPTTASADTVAIVVGLRRIVRALELYSQEVRRDFGLTAPQLWALKTVERTGPLSIGQLAEELLVHQSSTSLLVDRLERRGLVRRARSKIDKRFVRIELTDKAVALCRSAPQPAQGRLLHGLGTMSATRIRAIRRALGQLLNTMEAEDVEARFFFAGR